MFNTSLNNGGNEKVGTIKAFGGSVAPFGWLICDGSAISRTLYAALFDVIGETYGAGDGSTTFNLPNGKMPIGNSAECLGNGLTLGLDNSSDTAGLVKLSSGGYAWANMTLSAYGTIIGTTVGADTLPSGKTVGITSDSSKSGVIVDLTKANAASLAIIKY